MPNNFPTLKQFLLEYGEDNISAGLQQMVGAIRDGWRSSYSEIEKVHKRALKGLSPDQHNKIVKQINIMFARLLANPRTPVDVTPLMNILYSKQEVTAAATSFTALSAGIFEMARQFLQHAGSKNIITEQEEAAWSKNVQDNTVREAGTATLKFAADHVSFLQRVLSVDAPTITFPINKGADFLEKKLELTTDAAQKRDAVVKTYYLFGTLRAQLKLAADAVAAAAGKKNLPDETGGGRTPGPATVAAPERAPGA